MKTRNTRYQLTTIEYMQGLLIADVNSELDSVILPCKFPWLSQAFHLSLGVFY